MNSMFHEIHNDKAPKLKTLHFLVDYKFKHLEKPFPSVASFMVFVGKSRSGKSSLITSLLSNRRIYQNAFHNVIIEIPKYSFQSIEYAHDEGDTVLLIVDYASELKNGDVLKLLNCLVNNRRHLCLSIWMSVQTY